MHFVFILFAINHKLIAYWAISGFLFFHIKKAVSSNSKSLFLIIVIRQFTCPIVWVPFYRGRRNNPFYHLIFTVSAFHNPAFSFYIEYYNNKSYLFLKYLIIRINFNPYKTSNFSLLLIIYLNFAIQCEIFPET